MMYLVDAYGPQYGASAVSANGFSQYVFSAVFPLFAVQSKLRSTHFSYNWLICSVWSAGNCVGYKYTWVYFSSFAPDTLDSVYLGPEDSAEECTYDYRALKPEGCEGWNPYCLCGLCPRDLRISPMSFSASCHIYLVSIYDQSMIKASIINHPLKGIKSVLYSWIISSSNTLRRGQSLLVSYDSNKKRPFLDIN